ncbi:16S rRNA C967 or C1407 C5-methylase (RsmB/RsmF family) [Bacteroides zoogleoformans]|uniref:rRNA cytosine-C5-methyltransferase n=1 Tax=Bacteroides zoogleoformans TaxID=28119 RepID=A0ABN5II83_9BACE|nr:rRNA cytosine-C5-methyltransferase [Bacteroides zoogleoformans]AVM51763.1 rRNA cytosine-C5-methyltransferase [Bacteroides zoogleoformans]TWJ13807.1 16S rRNA C967 or C1407 C5-methylase (RsmB/RsmF family) [Bacteroides zoogleoformans]
MELPLAFTDYMHALLGSEEYDKLVAALDEEQPVSIRLNEEKLQASSFGRFRASLRKVPWSATGCYLNNRLSFTFDPLFHAGCYYVQEASSMFVEQALKQYVAQEPVAMLDLCAAPGGKSTLVRSLLPEGSLLVANEVVRSRSRILAENLTKWGHPDVVVTNNDPVDFSPLDGFFDVILTDVPCSGEGMFRKDPVAVSEWSPGNVEICRQRQHRIIADIWPCLKPGGILIYSTCTYNTKENEKNIRLMQKDLGAEVLPLQVPADWNITGNLLTGEDFPIYRFLPHKTEGEGFFLAVLRKPGQGNGNVWAEQSCTRDITSVLYGQRDDNQRVRGRKPVDKGTKSSGSVKEQLAVLRGWLTAPDEYEFLTHGDNLSAFSKELLPRLSALRSSLRIVQAGIGIAELKGKDWVPAHALAMSTALNRAAFVCEEIGSEQAIAYLRKETVVLPETAPRGVVLLTYQHIPLGFVKNIGNRANNLYPQEWRIRSGYMPEEISELAGLL